MQIRLFSESDYSAILDIYARSKLAELQYEDQQFELLPLENDEKRFAGLRESDIYVYDDNGVIAYGAVYRSEIRALFVHPSERGKGIGRCLLTFLLAKISKTESTACLYVAKSNVPAKNLYEDFGFKVTEEFATTYNGVGVVANKMMCIMENFANPGISRKR